MKTKWTVKLVSAVMAVGMISSCSVALNWDNIDKAATEVTEMTAEQLPVPDIGAVVASLPGNDLKNLPPEYFMLDESSMKIEKDMFLPRFGEKHLKQSTPILSRRYTQCPLHQLI